MEKNYVYALIDLHTTKYYGSESEAREAAQEWLAEARDYAEDSIKSASPETVAKWEAEERSLSQADDITTQIRLYRIDTGEFGCELDWTSGRAIIGAGYVGGCGVERIDTFGTGMHDIFSSEELKGMNAHFCGCDE